MENYMEIIEKYGGDILKSEKFQTEKLTKHHKFSTTYEHSLHVANISLNLVKNKKNISIPELIRGALLHDYYLYNWHNREEKWHKPHAYKHPKIAAENAKKDFGITEKEKDIIEKHMWPLTIKFPKYTESWIVTIADKIATFRERWLKKKF